MCQACMALSADATNDPQFQDIESTSGLNVSMHACWVELSYAHRSATITP